MVELMESEKAETTTNFWNEVRALDRQVQAEKAAMKKKRAKKNTNKCRWRPPR